MAFKGARNWKQFWFLHHEVVRWDWRKISFEVERVGYSLFCMPNQFSLGTDQSLMWDVIAATARAHGLTHSVLWERHILFYKNQVEAQTITFH